MATDAANDLGKLLEGKLPLCPKQMKGVFLPRMLG
jgi:hypothetical protein